MSSDSASASQPNAPERPDRFESHLQIRFETDRGQLLLVLPPEGEDKEATSSLGWNDLWQQLQHRLNAGERFWSADMPVHVMAGDRLLDPRQLQALGNALERVQLRLERVSTSRRQTAVAAATAGYCVEQYALKESLRQQQAEATQALAEPLYLQANVRSGVEVRHPGTVVVRGDVNPGGTIVARGDILVWGRLRGVAHAGAAGDARCLVMALQMEPTQIRIASFVARSPETPPAQYYAEVAYVTPQGIRISRAAEFAKTQSPSR